MQFTFGFTRGDAGWGTLPHFSFPDWRLVERSAQRLVYRPGLRTFYPRGAFALLVTGAMVYLYTRIPADGGGLQWAQGMLGTQSPEFPANVMRALLWVVIALAWLPALTLWWNRVLIEVTPRRELEVSTRALWRRSHTFPLNGFGGLLFGAQERIFRGRGQRITEHYWEWQVQLVPTPELPTRMPPVTFAVCRQPDHPNLHPRAPQRVLDLVNWLRHQTGVSAEGPSIYEASAIPGVLARGKLRSLQPVGEVQTSRQTYTSLQEMPPELRAKAEQMLAAGRTSGMSQSFTYSDSTGKHQQFSSLEEMPEDIRQIFEEGMRRRGE